MTKQEELKILDKIQKLINEAGTSSYIMMTFEGVVDICRTNIENDWGIAPVEEMERYRERATRAEERCDALDNEFEEDRARLIDDIESLKLRNGELCEKMNARDEAHNKLLADIAAYIAEASGFYARREARATSKGDAEMLAFNSGRRDALEDVVSAFDELSIHND